MKPITLLDILDLVQDNNRICVIHRIGPHECEAVAIGMTGELRRDPCMERCKRNTVQKIYADIDEWPEIWPETDGGVPVMVIVIGGKETIR